MSRADRTPGFARFLAVIRERWWIILLSLIVVGGLAFGVSLLIAPRYSATAQLVYLPDDAQLASEALSSSDTAASTHNIASDALTLETSAFAERVGQAMGTGASASDLRSAIRVSSDSELQVINVTAVGKDAYLVSDIATAFASEFVKQRQEDVASSLAKAQELVAARLDSLTSEEATSDYGLALKQQNDDLSVLISMQITDYKLLEKAILPTSPYFPRPFLNLLLGLCAGLVIGLLIAFMLNHLDRRIKDQSTLEQVLELPLIGSVPLASGKQAKTSATGNLAVGFREGNEALLESMRMLRSNLKVLGFGDAKRTLLVTSVTPGEGKSTLAVNLALTMALAGDRVVLVDADLRNPAIHQYLGIPNKEGLGDVLLDKDASWSTKIQAVDLSKFVAPQIAPARKPPGSEAPISKFLCLTSGPILSNPSEVLESSAMVDLLGELQGISDYLILDGPPMLVTSDSLILAQCVDAVVLACKLGRETAAEAVQVKQLLDRAEIAALGIVMSGSKPQSRDSYYYHHAGQTGEAQARKGV